MKLSLNELMNLLGDNSAYKLILGLELPSVLQVNNQDFNVEWLSGSEATLVANERISREECLSLLNDLFNKEDSIPNLRVTGVSVEVYFDNKDKNALVIMDELNKKLESESITLTCGNYDSGSELCPECRDYSICSKLDSERLT